MILCEDQGKMKLAAHANKYGLMMNAVVKIQGLIFLRIFRESIAGVKLNKSDGSQTVLPEKVERPPY